MTCNAKKFGLFGILLTATLATSACGHRMGTIGDDHRTTPLTRAEIEEQARERDAEQAFRCQETPVTNSLLAGWAALGQATNQVFQVGGSATHINIPFQNIERTVTSPAQGTKHMGKSVQNAGTKFYNGIADAHNAEGGRNRNAAPGCPTTNTRYQAQDERLNFYGPNMQYPK